MAETANGIPAAVRLHLALAAAGLPVVGVGRDKGGEGYRVDWGESPGKAQEDEARIILAEFDPAPSKMERLAQAGFGMERLLAALWEQVVEGDGALVEEIRKAM